MSSFKYLCVFFVFGFTACSSDLKSLENLGETDDFNNQLLVPDFEAPEDETVEQKNTCSGFVNTESSNLNVREAATTKSSVCAKLAPKATIMISQEGHKDGFLRVLIPKCSEGFSYVSEKFISLGSDCTFAVVKPKPIPPSPPTTKPPVDRNPDSLVNTFFNERKEFSLALGKAGRWDGCKEGYKSTGGYNSDTRCGRAFLHKKFSENLNDQFYKCVFQAADDAGYTKTQKVFINHLGSYNDRNARNSTRKSNHAYARALDIKNFNLVDDRGRVTKVSTLLRDYNGKQAKFYDEFRDCWRESMPTNCRAGKTEYKGSVGHTKSKLGGNSLHNDHIHLSFPLCAG